jgi:hypothetical protein
MATILPFLRNGVYFRDSVFEPHDIKAMSRALEQQHYLAWPALSRHNRSLPRKFNGSGLNWLYQDPVEPT